MNPSLFDYPDLLAWFRKHVLVCDIQTSVGEGDNTITIERWQTRGGELFVVMYGGKRGWNLYTPTQSLSINATLADAEERLGLKEAA